MEASKKKRSKRKISRKIDNLDVITEQDEEQEETVANETMKIGKKSRMINNHGEDSSTSIVKTTDANATTA